MKFEPPTTVRRHSRSPQIFNPTLYFSTLACQEWTAMKWCRRLRGRPEMLNTLIIALSGFGQDGDKQCSEEAGFNAHLVKPIELTELSEYSCDFRTCGILPPHNYAPLEDCSFERHEVAAKERRSTKILNSSISPIPISRRQQGVANRVGRLLLSAGEFYHRRQRRRRADTWGFRIAGCRSKSRM